MKEVSYKQDQVHSSPDGKTACWPICRGEYRVQTTDPEIAKVLKGWKGIEEVASGVNFFIKQFSVPGYKINRVLKLANLPPRKIPQWKVEQGKRLSQTVEKVGV